MEDQGAQGGAEYSKQHSSLSPQHVELIVKSGISPVISRLRGYRTETIKQRLRDLGFSSSQLLVPALVIPLFNARGEIINHQIRPDQPRLGDSRKPRKYETPTRSRVVIDVHPALSRSRKVEPKTPFDPSDLPAPIHDVGMPLIITEGSRKADSAVSCGLCAVALMGVAAWHRLPDWNDFPIKGRTVYLCFDSDAMQKRAVWIQLRDLKTWLESLGAKVAIIYLPPGPHGAKVGLDDWIAARKSDALTDADIREALFVLAMTELHHCPGKELGEDGRPEIVIIPGRRPWLVDRAEEVIVDYRRWKLFQRGGIVCRVVEIDLSERDEEKPLSIRRPDGAVVLKTVDAITLEDILGRGISWLRNQKGELVPADCPPKVAATYLSRVGQWRLPALTGVIEVPTVLSDGTIVDSPGYDPASGLYLYTRETWLPVPEAPSRAEAEAALRTLCEPFDEFPFVSEADRSVILSEVLTGLVRRQLPSAPLHGHDAPAQGSGKSLLADCTAMLLTGRPVASMPLGGDSEEIRKRITSVLLAGDLIVNIDNVVRPLKSDALAMAITQPIYADRVLGRNETPRLPTNLLWIATGNNLILAGDLTTRAIVCRIDADVERPEDRIFTINDLRAHIRRKRSKLVQAALTILRAYCVAGRPKQPIKRFGRFEEWSDWIRSALVWLGCADPCKTRERITLNDPERGATETVLAAWYVIFQDQMVLLRDVIAELELRDGGEKDPVAESARAALREAFLNVAASSTNPQKIDTRRLAAWCRENTDRIAGGLRLTRGDVEKHKTATWRVAASKKGDQTDSTGPIAPNLNGENGSDPDHSQVESFAAETDPSNPCDPPEERFGLEPGRIEEEREDSVDL